MAESVRVTTMRNPLLPGFLAEPIDQIWTPLLLRFILGVGIGGTHPGLFGMNDYYTKGRAWKRFGKRYQVSPVMR